MSATITPGGLPQPNYLKNVGLGGLGNKGESRGRGWGMIGFANLGAEGGLKIFFYLGLGGSSFRGGGLPPGIFLWNSPE